MKKVFSSLVLAGILALVAAMPVAAVVPSCDPGRASNPGTVTTYSEVTLFGSPYIDDVRAKLRDMNPFVEAGSNSYAYVSLRIDSNNYVRFGTRRSPSGVFRIFVTVVEGGTVIANKTYSESQANAVLETTDDPDGILNGSGGMHRFTINRAALGDYFEVLVDGNQLEKFKGWAFEPERARVGVEINDGGSQWWGDENQMLLDNIEIHNNSDVEIQSNLSLVNNTNKAATFLSADGRLMSVWDEDCV